MNYLTFESRPQVEFEFPHWLDTHYFVESALFKAVEHFVSPSGRDCFGKDLLADIDMFYPVSETDFPKFKEEIENTLMSYYYWITAELKAYDFLLKYYKEFISIDLEVTESNRMGFITSSSHSQLSYSQIKSIIDDLNHKIDTKNNEVLCWIVRYRKIFWSQHD